RVPMAVGQGVGRWPIGAAPVAIAAAAGSVWVADGPGPAPQPAAGANQVLQFTSAGQLVRSYPVPDPLDIVAAGDGAAGAYEQRAGVFVRQVSAGTAGPAIRLAGSAPAIGAALAWCPPGRLWAVSFDPATQRTRLQLFTTVAGQPLA